MPTTMSMIDFMIY